MMKQFISKEQLLDIELDMISNILNLPISMVGELGEDNVSKMFNIGKMIDILESCSYESKEDIDFYIVSLNYDSVDGYLVLVSGYQHGSFKHKCVFSLKTHKYNKCDALWETIKNKLNKEN